MTETTTQETPASPRNLDSLKSVVETLLGELKSGSGDRDKRRQVEEWMKSLAEKYPEFGIEQGLRDYYFAEAGRLRVDFDRASDLNDKLNIARAIESFLDRATDYSSRVARATR
jgi:hypothetical protein